MPARSQAQRRFFAFVEHNPEKAASEGIRLGMNHQQLHDFASTPEKGLPKYALGRRGVKQQVGKYGLK